MNRPAKIYLEQPIELFGFKVGHTYEGLKYLIDHYTQTMNNATPQQLDDNARQHCVNMIEKYRQHVQLYDKQNPITP